MNRIGAVRCGALGLVLGLAACAADGGDPAKAGMLPGSSSTFSTVTGHPSSSSNLGFTSPGTSTRASTSNPGGGTLSTSTPAGTTSMRGTSTTSIATSSTPPPPADATAPPADATPPPADAAPFDLCSCNPSKCGDCTSAVDTCNATAGCNALMQCVAMTPSCGGFPNGCSACGAMGDALNAGQSLAGCLGGCP